MGLTRIFGEKPIPKVLDFFIVNQFWDYSLKDISKETKISYRTLQTLMPVLINKRIIKYTRTEGKAKLYILNEKSKIVKQLKQMALEADLEFAEKTVSKEKVSISV